MYSAVQRPMPAIGCSAVATSIGLPQPRNAMAPSDHVPRECPNRLRARCDDADTLRAARSPAARDVGKSRVRPSPRSTGSPNAVAMRPASVVAALHRDLLAENRANGDLESVPGARCPNPRMPCEGGRQQRIAAEMLGNHRRIGVEVEDAADAFDDGEQRARIGEAHAECQRASFRGMRHLDRASVSVQPNRAVGSTRDRPVRHPASHAVRETPASDPSRTADGR